MYMCLYFFIVLKRFCNKIRDMPLLNYVLLLAITCLHVICDKYVALNFKVGKSLCFPGPPGLLK